MAYLRGRSPQALLEVLARWNPWGTATLRPGFPRTVLQRLEPFLESRDLVALIGPRRAGKTTVMFQVMELLERRGVAKKALLHVNLEEPALAPELGVELLERLYRTYRAEVFPTGRTHLFLDEVQHVPGWEGWVRARQDTEDLKVFVTGSSAALMSRELGTLLTGRHITFRVFPLSFPEYLRFRSIALPPEPRLVGTPAEIRNALNEYLRWGGFPEVVLAREEERKDALLKQYFDDVLFKDVAIRHQVRDLTTLRSLAVHLLTQTACLVSLKRIAGVFGVSLDLARSYCAYLEEAFLVSFVPFWSLKTAERLRRPQKVHALDLGLRNALSLTGSPDRGRLAETAVHNALAPEADRGLFYWQGKGEVDLVVRRGNEVANLIQVTYSELSDPDLLRREVGALTEANGRFPAASATLLVGESPALDSELNLEGARMVPLWRFLAGERPA